MNVLVKTLAIAYMCHIITVVVAVVFIILLEKDMLSKLNNQTCFWLILQDDCVENLII